MNKLRLHVCQECLRKNSADAINKLKSKLGENAGLHVKLETSPCLGPCDAPAVMTLQSESGAGYIFSGLDLHTDADDIVATCLAYRDSADGWIEDARPCGRLRFCLTARLPA